MIIVLNPFGIKASKLIYNHILGGPFFKTHPVGIAYVLFQFKDEKPKLIEAGSRSLCPSEKNWASSEVECLALVWSLLKTSDYITGCDNMISQTDNRPLLLIFSKSISDCPNVRIQRLRTKVSFTIDPYFHPGKAQLFFGCT